MSKKKKNGQASQSETAGRPKLLAIICIVSGAVGAWYWSDGQSATKSSLVEANLPRWDQPNSATVLIEPNTNDRIQSSEELVNATPTYGQLPADLVGGHQVELRPYSPPAVGTLEERVAMEPLPVVPIARGGAANSEANGLRGETRMAFERPPVWTDETGARGSRSVPLEDQLQQPGTTIRGLASTTASEGKADTWDTTNPFDQLALDPRSANPNNGTSGLGDSLAIRGKPTDTGWPDKNFRPERNAFLHESHALANQAATVTPRPANPTLGVFGATSVAVSPKIRPSEDPPAEISKLQPVAKLTNAEKIESLPPRWNTNATDGNDSKKSRAVIRQPRSGI